MYGDACRRKNPQHKEQFAHPGDHDWQPRGLSSSVVDLSADDADDAATIKAESGSGKAESAGEAEPAGKAEYAGKAEPAAASAASPAPKRSWGGSGHVLATGASVRPPRCYRNVVIVASFPWLGNEAIPPAHMTLLYWEGMGTPITEAHLAAVKAIVKRFDRPYNRRLDVDPSLCPPTGKSFLFDGQDVDPAGPVGEMIHALGSIDPDLPHVNSCGQSGLDGLHVSADCRLLLRFLTPIRSCCVVTRANGRVANAATSCRSASRFLCTLSACRRTRLCSTTSAALILAAGRTTASERRLRRSSRMQML